MKITEYLPGYFIRTDGCFFHNNRQIFGHKTKKGYIRVSLPDRHKFLHRIVAETFLGKPKPNQQVNHKNGIKNDNRVENLEWVSPSENLLHSYNVLGRKAAFEGKNMPDWIKKKISLSNKGRVVSDEHRRKNSEGHKGLATLGKNPNAKPVMCLETGVLYSCMEEAALALGVSAGGLRNAVRKNRKIKNYTLKKTGVKNENY